MTVADGSQVRLADVTEATIGTTPATPAFQIMRYVSADVRPAKQVEVTDEIRADRNVADIVDVGRNVAGTINTLLSYSTYDTWLARLLCSTWSSNVLVNGITHAAGSLEFMYEQGATDTFVRFRGSRFNTLDLMFEARKSVTANWGIMGIDAPAPATAIITGATYAAATTTEVFNAGLNVSDLTISGITASPKVQKASIKITNNIYQNDVIGSYAPYSHGLGRLEVTGSLTVYFENKDTYEAILNHSDVGIAIELTDAAGNSYLIEMNKVKLIDGGPTVAGNGRAVLMEVPFQAKYDSGTAGQIKITRTPAP
jgi:hypothetical protein